MLNERLQLLLTSEQRRRLEAEAARRATSVASLVREAIDARFEPVDRDRRRAALEEIEQIGERNRGLRLTVDELNELVDAARVEEILSGPGSP